MAWAANARFFKLTTGRCKNERNTAHAILPAVTQNGFVN
jgi:hypothetical protein